MARSRAAAEVVAMCVDAHAHIFPRIRGRIGDGLVIGRSYGLASVGDSVVQVLPPFARRLAHTPAMLLAAMRAAGVERAVLLQGPFYGYCNHYVGEAVSAHPLQLAGAVATDPWTTGRSGLRRALRAAPEACAFKLEFSERTGLSGLHPDAELAAPELAWLWDELDARGLVAVIDLGHIGGRGYQTEAVRRIALEHPRLRIVIAHLAQPNPDVLSSRDARRAWLRQISLGKLPNVSFDLASLPAYFGRHDSYRGMRECLRWAVEAIGPTKLLWGSDAPAMLTRGTYEELREVITERLVMLSSSELALVTGGNAAALFWPDSDCPTPSTHRVATSLRTESMPAAARRSR